MTTEVIAPEACEATALYRFYDSLGSLLYIGITSNITSRLAQHDQAQPWWRLVARVEVEHYPNREAAMSAEQAAIYADSPRFNKHHARGKMVMRSQYVPLKLWEEAKSVADANEENISDAVRIGLELYIKKKGKR